MLVAGARVGGVGAQAPKFWPCLQIFRLFDVEEIPTFVPNSRTNKH